MQKPVAGRAAFDIGDGIGYDSPCLATFEGPVRRKLGVIEDSQCRLSPGHGCLSCFLGSREDVVRGLALGEERGAGGSNAQYQGSGCWIAFMAIFKLRVKGVYHRTSGRLV